MELIGWLSSAVLVATVARQVWRQWASGTSDGVSTWLFVGQLAASLGFLVYSISIAAPVFAVTNVLLAAAAILGLATIYVHESRKNRPRQSYIRARGSDVPPPPPRPASRSRRLVARPRQP